MNSTGRESGDGGGQLKNRSKVGMEMGEIGTLVRAFYYGKALAIATSAIAGAVSRSGAGIVASVIIILLILLFWRDVPELTITHTEERKTKKLPSKEERVKKQE